MNGQEAFDQVVTSTKLGFSYKIIFTDFSMPVMDGIEASIKIKKFLQEGSYQIPTIIGITGHILEKY